MDLRIFLVVFYVSVSSPSVIGDRILVMWPLPASSHFKSFQPLFEEIVKQGHELTLVSGHPLSENLRTNYTHVNLRHKFNSLRIVFSEMNELNRLENIVFCFNRLYEYAEIILQQPEIQNLLRSNNSFDLIMVNLFFLDTFISFGYRFDAPVIGLCPQKMVYHDWMLGNPFPVSYVPHVYLPVTERMTFIERSMNAAYNFLTVLYMEFIAFPNYQKQMEKYVPFGLRPVPQLRDLISNISIVFINYHYSLNFVRPLLPNIIPVAGLHFGSRKPLPKNLQKFLDEADNEVVYISFGSLIEPENLRQIGETIVQQLSGRPQRVLMKWKPELLSIVPENFLVQEWMPQTDILNHPSCRLFITHGGLHSLMETLNASVPLIGVPFFSDQYHNLAAVEYFGVGKLVRLEKLDTDLLAAIDEILNDKKYSENIKKRARLFNDRESSPLNTAMYWVNHVLRNKGASHLKPESVRMAWYTYFSLDIIGAFIVILVSLAYVIYCSISYILKFSRRQIQCNVFRYKKYEFVQRKIK